MTLIQALSYYLRNSLNSPHFHLFPVHYPYVIYVIPSPLFLPYVFSSPYVPSDAQENSMA